MTFELDGRLAADSVPLGRLPLSLVRLQLDARYPWVVLVPAREGVREIHELARDDRRALIEEAAAVAEAMQRALGAVKMNVAALGNVVAQLHVIARFTDDDAWPRPVWGAHPALAYEPTALERRVRALRATFGSVPGFVPEP